MSREITLVMSESEVRMIAEGLTAYMETSPACIFDENQTRAAAEKLVARMNTFLTHKRIYDRDEIERLAKHHNGVEVAASQGRFTFEFVTIGDAAAFADKLSKHEPGFDTRTAGDKFYVSVCAC